MVYSPYRNTEKGEGVSVYFLPTIDNELRRHLHAVPVVHAYGLYDWDRRTREEMVGYDIYLEGVAETIAFLSRVSPTRIGDIVLCGGHTTDPDLAESESVKPELLRRLQEKGVSTRIHTETFSYTSSQNLLCALDIIVSLAAYNGWELEEVVVPVICDRHRWVKDICLSWSLLRHWVSYGVYGVKRPDPNWRSNFALQTLQGIRFVIDPQALHADLQRKERPDMVRWEQRVSP